MTAKPDKLLAEWFWVDRWMGSRGFLLPIAPRGLYREMLTQAWRRGAKLPNDHEAIRRAIGVTLKEWRDYWPLVSRFWKVEKDEEGGGEFLVNPTQQEIYATTMSLAGVRSRAGKAGNAKRWGGRNDIANGIAKPVANGIANDIAKPVAKQSPPYPYPDPVVQEQELEAAPHAARLAQEPNPNGNYRVIERLAGEVVRAGFWEFGGARFDITTEADLVHAVRDLCAEKHIDYGAHPDVAVDVVHRACASAWATKYPPRKARRA